MKTIYMVRHGETVYNKHVLFQGESDSPLTSKGIKQAKAVSKWFKDNNILFDEVYVSPANRCLETLANITKQEYIIVDDLHEMKFGCLEGKKVEFPYLPYDKYIKDMGGENYQELEDRIEKAIDKIVSNSKNNNILIVAHSGTFSAFVRRKDKKSELNYDNILSNSSILIYEYDDNRYLYKDLINLGC